MRGQRAEVRAQRIMLPLVLGVLLIGIWWLAVSLSGTNIFPSPPDVVRAVVRLAEEARLWAYIGDSLFRALSGYIAAVIVGIPLGILLGWYPLLARAVNPIIQMLRPISPLAWMPLAVIWFGVSNVAPIFLIFIASLFPVVVAATNAVRNVSPVFLQGGRNFGLSASQLMRRVVLPAILPRVLVGLRIAFGVAWLVLVAAEMIAVDSGLGYLIIDARNAGKRYDLVVAGMFLIGTIGLALDSGIRLLERVPSVRWGFSE